MNNLNERKQAFEAIDKNGNGIIEFKEWHRHFSALIRKKNATITMKEVLELFKKYEDSSVGIDFEEYSDFMDDIFGRGM